MQPVNAFSLETSDVAKLAKTSPPNIYVALHRDGHFRGIKPRKQPSGRWLWPRDQVERAFALMPDIDWTEGSEHILGWLRTKGVPSTAAVKVWAHEMTSLDAGVFWGDEQALSDAAMIQDICAAFRARSSEAIGTLNREQRADYVQRLRAASRYLATVAEAAETREASVMNP